MSQTGSTIGDDTFKPTETRKSVFRDTSGPVIQESELDRLLNADISELQEAEEIERVEKKRGKSKYPKLTEERLFSEEIGLPLMIDTFDSSKFRIKKGYELYDLEYLIEHLRDWAGLIYPRLAGKPDFFFPSLMTFTNKVRIRNRLEDASRGIDSRSYLQDWDSENISQGTEYVLPPDEPDDDAEFDADALLEKDRLEAEKRRREREEAMHDALLERAKMKTSVVQDEIDAVQDVIGAVEQIATAFVPPTGGEFDIEDDFNEFGSDNGEFDPFTAALAPTQRTAATALGTSSDDTVLKASRLLLEGDFDDDFDFPPHNSHKHRTIFTGDEEDDLS